MWTYCKQAAFFISELNLVIVHKSNNNKNTNIYSDGQMLWHLHFLLTAAAAIYTGKKDHIEVEVFNGQKNGKQFTKFEYQSTQLECLPLC